MRQPREETTREESHGRERNRGDAVTPGR
ncbi:uncharacterized protein G2W53_036977 [Senna tora]|uniref:Uncharacterized protein n=1 Tax=Senna tora TaxID=362788 RepID=A0A834SUM7_9FABA|nr:uncharacterized protein G2W53_036977 [Senna tora]